MHSGWRCLSARLNHMQDPWMPSMWKLHAITWLVGHERAKLHHLEQGYGGHSPKPTALLVIAPEHEVVRNSLQRYMQSQHCQRRFLWVEWMASTALPDSRTTPLFCRALAGIAEACCAASYFAPAIPQPESDLDFLAYVARLRCGFNQSAQRGLDCT